MACVFIRIIFTTFCLYVSPKLLDSLPIPVLIGNLQENEVMELLMLCYNFLDLKMRSGTIYTATNEGQVPNLTSTDELYKGTAMFVDYDIPVVNKALLEIWQDTTVRHLLTEISLRIINVVESVGIFLLIKISMLACHIVNLSQIPQALLRTVVLYLDIINNKFYQLNIPRKPIEEIHTIIRPYCHAVDYSPLDKTIFQNASIRFMDKYCYLNGFVDIGNVDLTSFNPNTNTIEEFLNTQLVFIKSKVDKYFNM